MNIVSTELDVFIVVTVVLKGSGIMVLKGSLRNACLRSCLRFWTTGPRSSCLGFDLQLLRVNILRLRMIVCQRGF